MDLWTWTKTSNYGVKVWVAEILGRFEEHSWMIDTMHRVDPRLVRKATKNGIHYNPTKGGS